MRKRRSRIWWLGLVGLLLAWGCASTGARSGELLAKPYAAMADEELRIHYQQLNDQIARVERSAREGVRGRAAAEDLRDRRNEVRAEISRRGLQP